MPHRVAVFVDGENVGAAHAAEIADLATARGEVVLARVYGDVGRLNGWREARGYTLVHAGKGKNATDILLALDALDLALADRFETCIVASSDRDFSHLAVKLRERGVRVVGTGPSASDAFVAQCSSFARLPCRAEPAKDAGAGTPLDDLDRQLRCVIERHGEGGAIRITDLNPIMLREHDLRIGERPERSWRGFFAARSAHYEVDPKGPQATVRLRQATGTH